MKTLILDGSPANDAQAGKIVSALRHHLPDAETVVLRDQKIGNCAGEFFCWIRSPGVCGIKDDNRVIAAKIAQSDLVVYLTPVTFGGYSSQLKRMVDHQIQNISPFFASIKGEVHHQKRYQHYPDVLTIGWMDRPDPRAESIFRHLVHRNAINMYSQTSVCGLVTGNLSEAELISQTKSWLEDIARGESSPVPILPATNNFSATAMPVHRAVMLVGSPRTRKSTSASLGGYLFEQLNQHGVETQTIYVYTQLNSHERMKAMLDAIDNADLIVLAFPLYVDNLPGPIISALEQIALHRGQRVRPAAFAAIANCGFPGARQNDTALAICGEFARTAGLQWLGGLALGMGEGLVHGAPLNELDGRAASIKKALALAAEALEEGQPIPQAARELLAKPIIPAWLYRLFGHWGWKHQAKRFGAQHDLQARPYQTKQVETLSFNAPPASGQLKKSNSC